MVIHSVTPAHMLAWQDESLKSSTKQIGNSFIDIYEAPGGLYMSGIHSTDLSMYLKPENTPGSKFDEKTFTAKTV